MITEHNCTVFNIVYNKEKRNDEYVITHLYGVHWENVKAVNAVKSGLTSADSVNIYIPFSVKSKKSYVQPKMFAESHEGHFTFAPGDKIVKGIVDYSGNIAKIVNSFDDAVTITSVDTFDYGNSKMRHYKISGK